MAPTPVARSIEEPFGTPGTPPKCLAVKGAPSFPVKVGVNALRTFTVAMTVKDNEAEVSGTMYNERTLSAGRGPVRLGRSSARFRVAVPGIAAAGDPLAA